MEGAGKAGRLMHPQPRTQMEKAYEQFTTGTPEITAFPARWFYGFLRARPGDRALLSPSQAMIRSIIANLISASGYQTHTTSPSATSAFVSCTVASIASRANES